MSLHEYPVSGAGLGLRNEIMDALAEQPAPQVGFMEVAPENWIGIGGRMGKQFRRFTERYPFVCHGLSLSLGGPAPLDEDFILRVRDFMDTHQIPYYSEHLSYCSDDGHLYDLMPIPFTEEAADYVVERILRTQDLLGRRMAVENVSYYAAPGKRIEEIDFLLAVLAKADCDLLLDVNNIYVNAVNHNYDPYAFLDAIPTGRIAYIHTAGHHHQTEDLIIDTHGAEVVDPVWDLLEAAYQRFGVVPTLLERDFNLPPLPELLAEVDIIAGLQDKWSNVQDDQPIAAAA